MWIVRLALRRPYTFVVAALVLILFGGVTLVRMPVDIFPEIDIPVVSVIWSYGGISPEEMKKRLKTDPEFKRLSQIRDGSAVFAYYPDRDWLSTSPFLHCGRYAQTE